MVGWDGCGFAGASYHLVGGVDNKVFCSFCGEIVVKQRAPMSASDKVLDFAGRHGWCGWLNATDLDTALGHQVCQ
jgi:hypothetical protein